MFLVSSLDAAAQYIYDVCESRQWFISFAKIRRLCFLNTTSCRWFFIEFIYIVTLLTRNFVNAINKILLSQIFLIIFIPEYCITYIKRQTSVSTEKKLSNKSIDKKPIIYHYNSYKASPTEQKFMDYLTILTCVVWSSTFSHRKVTLTPSLSNTTIVSVCCMVCEKWFDLMSLSLTLTMYMV